jgi:hypothetical protein
MPSERLEARASGFQRIVAAIKETTRLMAEVDKAIPKWPIA